MNKLIHHVYTGAPVPEEMAMFMQTAIDAKRGVKK